MYIDRKIVLILAAAGKGTRLGYSLPKQFIKMEGLDDRSPLQKSILTAGIVDEIDEVIVVTNPEYIDLTYEQIAEEADAHSSSGPNFESKDVLQSQDKDRVLSNFRPYRKDVKLKRLEVIEGGASRQESTALGIKFALQDKPENYIVLIHDAARPNASPDLYRRVIKEAYEKGAVVPAVRLKDTIRDVKKGTLNRDDLRAVQTPQGFVGEIILNAIKYAEEECFVGTDEGSLVDFMGLPVSTVLGSESNIKITSPEDLTKTVCIGAGYDVHAFSENRKLILGGVDIPFEKGLLGHSDADVLTHALMDAILGAMGEGDIGLLFPDTAPEYKGVSSIELLKRVVALMNEKFYTLENADITVICQMPKIRPYIDEMKKNLELVLSPKNGINIKGTTTEKLGFEGRGEGIAASATVLLSKPSWD
ncbi:MAG: 2-C-methyl-D-erythritol 2,4-cyclodiphosphate synthase [Christensenellales bacterium]